MAGRTKFIYAALNEYVLQHMGEIVFQDETSGTYIIEVE